jgi:hypothetical protein
LEYRVCIDEDLIPVYEALDQRAKEQLDEVVRLLSIDPYPSPESRLIRMHGSGDNLVYSWWDRYVRHVIYYLIDPANESDCDVLIVGLTDPDPQFFE